MSRGIRMGIIFAAMATIIIFAVGALSEESSEEKVNDIFSLSLLDSDGNAATIADYKGRPLVVNSWASWCPFCVKELPDFATVQEELGESVVIIAVNRRETPARAKEFTDSLGVTDKLVFLLDEDDAFYGSIGGRSMPETIFVNSEGVIVEHKRGVMNMREIREKINSVL